MGVGDAVVDREKCCMDNVKEWTSPPMPEVLKTMGFRIERLEEDLC